MSDFQNVLLKGEKLLWTGKPARGLLFTPQDWFWIPFSLMWCGFAIFWEATVVSSPKSPDFMKLWGVPFVLVGLYMVVGRFVLDAWLRRGARYAVTNKRVLISRPWPFASFSAMGLRPDAGTSSSRLTRMVGGPFASARRYRPARAATAPWRRLRSIPRCSFWRSTTRGEFHQIIQEAAQGDAA